MIELINPILRADDLAATKRYFSDVEWGSFRT